MDGVVAALAVALIAKVMDFVKQVQGGQMKDAFTQLVAWVVAILIVILVAASDFGNAWAFLGKTVDSMNVFSLVILGMALGSGASILYEFKPKKTPSLGERAPD